MFRDLDRDWVRGEGKRGKERENTKTLLDRIGSLTPSHRSGGWEDFLHLLIDESTYRSVHAAGSDHVS